MTDLELSCNWFKTWMIESMNAIKLYIKLCIKLQYNFFFSFLQLYLSLVPLVTLQHTLWNYFKKKDGKFVGRFEIWTKKKLVKGLKELVPDAKHPLELVEADLLKEDSWKAYVFSSWFQSFQFQSCQFQSFHKLILRLNFTELFKAVLMSSMSHRHSQTVYHLIQTNWSNLPWMEP